MLCTWTRTTNPPHTTGGTSSTTGTTHNTTTGTTPATGTTHSTTGSTPKTSEGVAGPHSSRVANAADPRVDSDLDGSRNAGAHSHGTTTTGSGLTGSHATTGSGLTGNNTHSSGLTGNNTSTTHSGAGVGGASYGTYSTTPHSSNTANKLDPRVDSDLDGSRNLGATQVHGEKAGSGLTGNNTHSSGLTGNNHSTHTGTGVGSTGTSGLGGTHAGNTTTGHTGTTGGLSSSTNAGPHNSNVLNKADPRVDSDLDGKGNRHGASTGHGITGASGSHATPGSGTAQNTAGPHNSDMLNKLDPRVDADRDGSKTVGGNKTFA